MKKIIVPVDFSKHSEYALETAAALAHKTNAELLVLHMLELSEILVSAPHSNQNTLFYLKLAEKQFEDFLNKNYLSGLKITPIIKHFKVFSEVSKVAKREHAELIIMGSQGTSGLKELLIGSNTEKVVRYSAIPVLIVKHNPILTAIETVVFACDFSEKAIKSYNYATTLFKKLGIKMHLVYINTPYKDFKSSSEMEHQIATFLKKADSNLSKMRAVAYINDYSVEKGILSFSKALDADLIALATYGRKGLSHFFEGSISEDIANHSTLPVMTFRI